MSNSERGLFDEIVLLSGRVAPFRAPSDQVRD